MTETPKPGAGTPSTEPARTQDPTHDKNKSRDRDTKGNTPGTGGQSESNREGGKRAAPGQEHKPQDKAMAPGEAHKHAPAKPESRNQDGGTPSV